jgi:hypothetical protein
LLELPAAGERAQQQRRELHEQFVAVFAALAAQSGSPVTEVALRVMVSGITELIAAEVAAGRLEQLGELEDELVAVVRQTLRG